MSNFTKGIITGALVVLAIVAGIYVWICNGLAALTGQG